MRVPLSWLRDFVPFDDDADPKVLAETLDDLGLVVEEMNLVGEGLSDVVVARVVSIESIPGADRVRKVVVDTGGEPVEVVCGAWNFSEGALVPLAPVGTVLPGGVQINRRKLKGVVSNGMICSGKELQLSEDHEGILVLGEGDSFSGSSPSLEPGTPLGDALGIEPDVVFDVAVDANRPDAACIAGVARDLAAKLHFPFDIPNPSVSHTGDSSSVIETVSLDVIDSDLCPRFTLRVVSGVAVGPSPPAIARRLILAGMRPINNVVDASNYVMLELGQPTHPYDLDRLRGRGLIVRAARKGERVLTLDGVERELGSRSIGRGDDMRDCVICDAENSPIGIGGVMGGATTEIEADTSWILLEAAYFAPMAIARTSKRLGLRSEASSRFERGVDANGIDRAASRLCELLISNGGDGLTVAPGVLEARGEIPGPRRVSVRTARVNAMLGTDLMDGAIARYLTPIGFGCEVESPGSLLVTVPTFRPDTEREIDVIEEVARHHGYVNIPRRRVFPPQVGRLTAYQRDRRRVRQLLAGAGADEAWTPSLLAPGDHARGGSTGAGFSELVLANPLTPEELVLRRSILPGMLKALVFNLARRAERIRLFEIGHVFPPPSPRRVERSLEHDDPVMTVVDEREMLAVLLAADGDDASSAVRIWRALSDALGLEGIDLVGRTAITESQDGLHPSRTADLVARDEHEDLVSNKPPTSAGTDQVVIGAVGEIDPGALEAYGIDTQRRVGWIEVNLGTVLTGLSRRVPVVTPVSRFPSNDIDLAFVVEESIPAGSVTTTLVEAAGELLESLELFDVYRGAGLPGGTRSLAWRLRFCALDHTLTDSEVGDLRARCIEAVERAHGAQLRG